jgi:DNA-binding ferritin-like protein
MDKVYQLANLYVATLRSIYLIHQHSHWKTKGTGFYGNHLLFERLYQSAQENADLAAEKFIGLFGENAVNYDLQNQFLHKLLSKYADFTCPCELALGIEKDFLAFSKQVYDILETEKMMTLGLDDMIMAIASKREESCYLLQQTLEQIDQQ